VHRRRDAHDFLGPRHALRQRFLLDLLLDARPGQAILNAGAGRGSFSRLLEDRGFDVVSSDISAEACDVLARRVRGPVVRADVTELPFADSSFDAVVLGEVIEHVADDVAALRESRRVLRPGGMLVLSVPAHPTWFGPSDRWAGHVRRYSRAALISACLEADFAVVRCAGWGFPVSALYHRLLYDKRAQRLAAEARTSPRKRIRLGILKVALQLDRLFLGVERGALGFLLLAQRPDGNQPEPRQLGREVEAKRQEHERVGGGEGESTGKRNVERLPEHR
jgi:ubiquinone/menaquinone biosynthesis C-methylase UbiE